jgi:hypothetical protein
MKNRGKAAVDPGSDNGEHEAGEKAGKFSFEWDAGLGCL